MPHEMLKPGEATEEQIEMKCASVRMELKALHMHLLSQVEWTAELGAMVDGSVACFVIASARIALVTTDNDLLKAKALIPDYLKQINEGLEEEIEKALASIHFQRTSQGEKPSGLVN